MGRLHEANSLQRNSHLRQLVHSNSLIASQLQDLGFDIQALHRRFNSLESSVPTTNTIAPPPSTSKPSIPHTPSQQPPLSWYTPKTATIQTPMTNNTTPVISHQDMIDRLEKIGNDLQITAKQLHGYK